MADTERILLYVGIGFLGTLFVIKSVRALRPASAYSMYTANTSPLRFLLPSSR